MEPVIDSSFEILYEDDTCVAVSKSGNCPVHEGGLYFENTLNRLLEKKYGYRLYPVYRIDRETSGIVVFAKKRDYVNKIVIEDKEYVGVVEGIIKERTVIDEPIGEVKGDFVKWKMSVVKDGKKSLTIIEPITELKDSTVVRIYTKTGRQHQIRVHMQYIKHPIVGDKLYGKSDKIFKDYLDGKTVHLPISRQALHLHKITLNNKELTAKLPDDINELISRQKCL